MQVRALSPARFAASPAEPRRRPGSGHAALAVPPVGGVPRPELQSIGAPESGRRNTGGLLNLWDLVKMCAKPGVVETPVIPALCEADTGGVQIRAQPGQFRHLGGPCLPKPTTKALSAKVRGPRGQAGTSPETPLLLPRRPCLPEARAEAERDAGSLKSWGRS